jgi:hypothetical protein
MECTAKFYPDIIKLLDFIDEEIKKLDALQGNAACNPEIYKKSLLEVRRQIWVLLNMPD